MKKLTKLGCQLFAVSMLAAFSPAAVNAAIIFNDTFEDIGGVSTKLNDAGDPADLSWYSALSNGTASLTNDPFAGGGSQKALLLSSPDTFRRLGANFSATALGSNIGDKLVLSFVMRLAEAPPGTTNLQGFRFGLYNSNGTATVSDNANGTNQPPLQADDFGYYGRASVGPVTGVAADIVEELANDNPLGGNGGTAFSTPAGGNGSINDQTLHSFVFELTRSAPSTIDFALSIDNILRATGSDATPITTTFDAVYFGQGNISTDFVIDNVKFESIAVPEPGAVFAGVAALGGIFFLRRPKSRR